MGNITDIRAWASKSDIYSEEITIEYKNLDDEPENVVIKMHELNSEQHLYLQSISVEYDKEAEWSEAIDMTEEERLAFVQNHTKMIEENEQFYNKKLVLFVTGWDEPLLETLMKNKGIFFFNAVLDAAMTVGYRRILANKPTKPGELDPEIEIEKN